MSGSVCDYLCCTDMNSFPPSYNCCHNRSPAQYTVSTGEVSPNSLCNVSFLECVAYSKQYRSEIVGARWMYSSITNHYVHLAMAKDTFS